METQKEFQRIQQLLIENHIEPKRSFGQNFLIDSDAIDSILTNFDIPSYDTIIEIGPGLGALTLPLSMKAKKLIAIDADRDMTKILDEIFKSKNNVQIINCPFEQWEPPLFEGKTLVIGNIPYNITSKLIGYSTKLKANDLGFMIQKEVADKLIYKAGDKNNNALSYYLALLGEIKTVLNVYKGSFYPIPKVDSAFVSLHITEYVDYSVYLGLKYLFVTPNKTLNNVLSQFIHDKDELNNMYKKYISFLSLRTRQIEPKELLPIAKDLYELIKKK